MLSALGGTRHLGEDFGLPAGNKRHTMSHAPEHIPEIESPIKRRKPESRSSTSPIKSKKSRVSEFLKFSFSVCLTLGPHLWSVLRSVLYLRPSCAKSRVRMDKLLSTLKIWRDFQISA